MGFDIFSIILILTLIAIPLILVCLIYPEIAYALFIWSNTFKGNHVFNLIDRHIDLTVFFEIVVIISLGFRIIRENFRFFRFNKYNKKLVISLVFICFMMIFGLLYTNSPIYGTDKLLRFLFITIPTTFLALFLFKKEQYVIRFFFITCIISSIFGIFILNYALIRKINVLNFYEFVDFFGVNNILVSRLGFASLLIVLFYFIPSKIDIKAKLPIAFLVPFVFVCAFAPGEKGPFIAALFAIICGFISIIVINREKILIRTFLVLFFTILLFMIMYNIYSGTFIRFQTRILEIKERGSQSLSIATRLERISIAIKNTLDFPEILIGVGTGGFNALYKRFDSIVGDYPHNIFIEFWCENGLISLFAFIYLIILTVRKVIGKISSPLTINSMLLNTTLFVLIIYSLINAMFSGDINGNRILFAIIGFIFSLESNSKGSPLLGQMSKEKP